MTGYGEGEIRDQGYRIKFEILSLNSKYLDLVFNLPYALQVFEPLLKKWLSSRIFRGRIQVRGYIDLTPKTYTIDFNKIRYLAQNLLEEFKTLQGLNLNLDIIRIIQDPDFRVKTKITPNIKVIRKAFFQALNELISSKKSEGKNLEKDIRNRISSVDRLTKRIRFISRKIKTPDITEELTRIDSHLKSFRMTMRKKPPIGRKLEFICQELQREVNTIGQKSTDLRITNLIIELKEELERIKEQIKNIE